MRTHRFRNPDELISTIEHVRLLLKKGALVESPSQKTAEHFDINTWSGKHGDLPEFFEIRFQEVDTGETVVLYCDTYHGGGGALMNERELKRKDMIRKIVGGLICLFIVFVVLARINHTEIED